MIHSATPPAATCGFLRQVFRHGLLGLATVAGFSASLGHAQYVDWEGLPPQFLPTERIGSGAVFTSGSGRQYQNTYSFAALNVNGSIAAFGDSSRGGSGAPTDRGYTAIYSNSWAFAALKEDGSITAWGDATKGGSGPPTDSGYTAVYSTPTAFAALKSDGSIRTWGDSTKGGSGGPTDSGYQAVYSADYGFSAVKADGSIRTWGDPDYSVRDAPTDSGHTAICSGGYGFAALKPDGSISTWGYEFFQRVEPPTDSGYVSIYPAGGRFAALKADGSISVWGGFGSWDTNGPTGKGFKAIESVQGTFAALNVDGTLSAWGAPNDGRNLPPAGSDYTAIFGTQHAFAALKSDGSISAWGSSASGGSGAPTDSGYKMIYSNSGAFAAIKEDGSIRVWGYPGLGGSDAPTDNGYTAIYGNGGAFAATKADGSIRWWGRFDYDQTEPPLGTGYHIQSALYHSHGPGVTTTLGAVTKSSAVMGGTLGDPGNVTITERGVIYANSGVNADPRIGGSGVTRRQESPVGVLASFTLTDSDLSANTEYSFRAYITDSLGWTYYGRLEHFSTNQAPVITSQGGGSSAVLAFAENRKTVTTVFANDEDGLSQTLSYRVVGGADAGKFTMNGSTGVLEVLVALDFESPPSDANGDGVFEVTVQVEDNGNPVKSDTQALFITVTDVAEAPNVSTPTRAEVTPVRATLGGTVVNDGGGGDAGLITARGVVFSITSLNSDPRLGGLGVSNALTEGAVGSFSLAAIALSPGMTYSYRPYAANAQGVSYGSVATFTTGAGPALTGDVWTHYAGSTTGVAATANGTGSAARFNGPAGITFDGNGDPFVADTLSHTIRKIVGDTAAVSTPLGVAGTAGSNDTALFVAPKFNNPGAMTVFGPNGGTAGSASFAFYVADTGNHTVRRATWSFLGGWSATTWAGTANSSGATNGTGAAARFNAPKGIAVDTTNTLYLADTGNHAIRKITPGQVVSTHDATYPEVTAWGLGPINWVPKTSSPIVSAATSFTHVITAQADGTVERWSGVYEELDAPADLTGVSAVACGKGLSVALKFDGTVVAWGNSHAAEGIAVPAGLSGVKAISARDFNVMALKQDGTVVAWGDMTNGMNDIPAGLSGVSAVAAGGGFAMALKTDGTVVAWGSNNYQQTQIPANLSGVVAIAAGGGHSVALKSDGTVVTWGLNNYGQRTVPQGLVDVKAIAAGDLFTLALKTDGTLVSWGDGRYGTKTIPALLGGGNISSIVAANFSGLAFTQPLNTPKGVAVDAQGNLFIADSGNRVIRKYIAATGVLKTLAGSFGQSGTADGVGTAARFNSPRGITVDAEGNVYVTDEVDHTVRWITRDGIVRTIGGLPGSSGLASGSPEAARFNQPSGITTGGAALYLADTANNRIVKGTPLFRPILGTAGASEVALTSVTLNGWVNPNGKATTASFEYGLTAAYGSNVALTLASNTSTNGQLVSAGISGLTANKLYHYRILGTNSDGTAYSQDSTFSTGSLPVVAAAPVVVSVAATSAVLSGSVTADGFMTLGERGFVYAVSAANATPEIGGSGVSKLVMPGEIGDFSLEVTGLTAATTYSFRAYATNSAGISYSNVAVFTTTTAAGSPSETWRQLHFGTNDNTGNAAELATPDGDGITNLMKYALGLTPGTNGAGGLPKAKIATSSGSRYLSLNFRRDPSHNDVTIVVEAQAKLGGTWTEIARSANGAAFTGPGGVTETDAANGTKDVEVRDTQTIGSAARRFMRVRVYK
jgi:alpha-tubulin suppressor-like RCC1 family protein